jgi:PAS domain S-box-containing protein
MNAPLVIAVIVVALIAAAAIVYASSRSGPSGREDTRLGNLRRAAYERAPGGIGFVDGESHWLFFNDRLLQILGYEAAELRRLSLRQLTHPQDRKREASLFGALQAGRKSGYTILKRLQRKDGSYQEYRVQLTRISESPVAHQCTIEKLRSDAPPLDQFVEALGELQDAAVIRCDNTGMITGWNRGAERLFGYTAGEIQGSSWSRLTPGGTSSIIRDVPAPARAGMPQAAEVRIGKDGDEIAVRSTIIRYGGAQELSGFVEVCYASKGAVTASMSSTVTADVALRAEVARYAALEASLRRRIGSEQRANEELTARVQSLTTELQMLADRDGAQTALPVDDPPSQDWAPAAAFDAEMEMEMEFELEAEQAPPLAAAAYVGSASGKARIYHRVDCTSARQRAGREQMVFATPDEAEAQQFRACKRCLPRARH